MNFSNKLLARIVAFRTYAKHLTHLGRRETLEETINRNMQMHLDRFPSLSRDIVKAYQKVHELKVMPSMRGMQFAGEAILKNNARQYNCSFVNMDDIRAFGESLYLLLSGVGVGYSVQKRHTTNLPKIKKPKEEGFFLVQDSIMGWAQALDLLLESYFLGRVKPQFDFGDIRPKGSYLVTTGAKAPGPAPLKKMLELVEEKLKAAIGRQLRPIEVHDIVCIISDSVLAGGIRRAALVSLFDRDDKEMLTCKHGEWWNNNPWRARANNSAVLPRSEVTKEEFDYIFSICKDSNSGEPGFFWTNDLDMGTNPCVAGDTEILTDTGYIRIDELVDREVIIWNGFEWSKVTPKVTGKNQEMLKFTFSDGRTLTTTKYHKFHIAKGYSGNKEIINAENLKVGDKLIKHEFPIIDSDKNLEAAYLQGFHSAEGMDGYKFIYIYEPKLVCLDERLRGFGGTISKLDNYNRVRFSHGKELLPKSFVPINYSVKTKVDWLAGLFDGDGTELEEGGLQLASIDFKFLFDTQKLLSTLGIQSKIVKGNEAGKRLLPNHKGDKEYYDCKETKRLCIGAVQIQSLKKLGMHCSRLKFEKEPQRDASQFIKIVSIEEMPIEETVYCFTEPKNNTGIFNGIITGQCAEISLNSNQFCNLTTINQTGITSEKDFMNRVYAATLIGTLQASYTDFDYIRPSWRTITEREALLGVSFTGIADANGTITPELLAKGAQHVLDVNEKYAKKLGINMAARTTTVKPEGSASCVLGSSSGIHARHAPYYIRRVRMNKDDALAIYLKATIPELVEDDKFSSSGVVVSIPQESPVGATTRHEETAATLLSRTLQYRKFWIENGHRSGVNKHNVSVTISVRNAEWDELKESMWENREYYSGISLLPFSDHTYIQAPFEDCSEEVYTEMSRLVKDVDLRMVTEEFDNTNRVEQLACAGGLCEIT